MGEEITGGALASAAATSAETVTGIGLSALEQNLLWGGIALYIVVLLGIGIWSSRRVKGMNDFLVAGRRLPLWMATATLLATWFGAGSSMGVAATVYTDGLGGVLADPFGASLSLIFAGIFIVGALRKLNCLTVTDVIARRFGAGAGVYASAWMVPVYIGWLGAQLLGMGTILHVLTGMEVATGTLIGAAVVLIYTFAGGMWAVTLTDVVQVSLIVFGLVLIIPGAISDAGGWTAMWERVPGKDLSLWISPEASGEGMSGLVYYIGSWIIMGLGCMVGQDLVQRSLSSRTEKIAQISSVASGILYALIGIIPILIGFAARIVLVKHGITDAVMGGDSELENQVLPRMAVIVLGQLHPIILTVFLAALISAIMSSADSSLLAGSSLLCNNILSELCPKFKDKDMLLMTRISTVALTAVGLWLALEVESIYALMINSWASQLVVVFMPVLAAIFMPRATKPMIWTCMLVSTAVWIFYAIIGSWGTGYGFVDLMNSDEFDKSLTCGAVYGFFAGVIVLFGYYFYELYAHASCVKLWQKTIGKPAQK